MITKRIEATFEIRKDTIIWLLLNNKESVQNII
jgi:hypothetical protein